MIKLIIISAILCGVCFSSDTQTESIATSYSNYPLVFIGEVLEKRILDESIIVTFQMHTILKNETTNNDTISLCVPPHVWRSVPSNPEDRLTGTVVFEVNEEYLVFSNERNEIECCGSIGNGYYLLYPFNDYYCHTNFWNTFFKESILIDDDLTSIQAGDSIEVNYHYRVNLHLPISDEVIEFDLAPDGEHYRVSSEINTLDGLRAWVTYTRRSRRYLYCRDANDIRVTLLNNDNRPALYLIGTIDRYESNRFYLNLYITRPILENTMKVTEYLDSLRAEPTIFNIDLYFELPYLGRINIGTAKFSYEDNTYRIYFTDEAIAYPPTSALPTAVTPDCRYLVMQISYLGIHDGEPDYIAFECNAIPEDFHSDIPFNLYDQCIQAGSLKGNVYIIDDFTSDAKWLCFYEIAVQ